MVNVFSIRFSFQGFSGYLEPYLIFPDQEYFEYCDLNKLKPCQDRIQAWLDHQIPRGNLESIPRPIFTSLAECVLAMGPTNLPENCNPENIIDLR